MILTFLFYFLLHSRYIYTIIAALYVLNNFIEIVVQKMVKSLSSHKFEIKPQLISTKKEFMEKGQLLSSARVVQLLEEKKEEES